MVIPRLTTDADLTRCLADSRTSPILLLKHSST